MILFSFSWFLFCAVINNSSPVYSIPQESQPCRLRVMTFNIRYNHPADSIYAWDYRKQMVYNVISREDPDVIGMQEALAGQVKDLKQNLPAYDWIGIGRDDGKKAGEFTPIFYKSGKFQKIREETTWLSETPDIPGSVSWNAACTRILSWIELQEKTTGQHFFVFNTHFDHVSKAARMHSAELLLNLIHQVADTCPVIVTGDFNLTPHEETYKVLSGELINPLRDFLISDSVGTFIGFPAKFSPGNIVDYIFIRPSPRILVEDYRIVGYHEGIRYPSDHLPVVSEIILKEYTSK